MPPLPSTPRQLLRIDVAVLAAVALLWNRPNFPEWARPEFYGLQRHAQLSVAGDFWQQVVIDWDAPEGHRVELEGHDTLLIGDSVVLGWPWPHDLLSFAGHTAPEILEHCREELDGTRRYRQILLWVGTAHFFRNKPARDYVDAVVDLTRLAQEHADAVYIISPVPGTRLDETEAEQTFARLARDADAQLRVRLPDVPIYYAAEFRREMIAAGRYDALYGDPMHMNAAGFQELVKRLAPLGFSVAGWSSGTARVEHARGP